MQKISITIDLSKLDKTRIVPRTYTNKEGIEVTVKEYKMDVVEMKPENQKSVFKGDGFEIVKTHFVTNTATKEERAEKAQTGFLGEGVSFKDTKEVSLDDIDTSGDIDQSIPF